MTPTQRSAVAAGTKDEHDGGIFLRIGRETGRQSGGNCIAKLGHLTANLGQYENGRKWVSLAIYSLETGGIRRQGICAVVS